MAQTSVTVQDTLRLLVEAKRYSTIKEILKTMTAQDIAAVFDDLQPEQLSIMFRLLSRDLAGETFIYMSPENQEVLIKGFSDTELRQVLSELYADDAADLVEEMPANVVTRILSQADASLRKDINELLKYPEDSAGTLMTTEFIVLTEDMTIRDAFSHIRKNGVDKETIYTCYVTWRDILKGTVSAKDLMLAKDQDATIDTIMNENVISVNTNTDREEVARLFQKYNFMAMPVVDAANRLAGIITFDDVMDVIEEETTEDMAIMSGQNPYDKSYDRLNPFELFMHRIPWLLVLMVSATFTGIIITNFEAALSAQVVLTAFIPMLMDTGGNSGSQSSVTIIRALSLGEIEFKDLPKVIGKEVLTALLCGLALACVCFGKLMLVDRLLMNNPDVTVTIGLVVCLTMFVTVMIAKIVGCSLPIIAKKLGFDPAVMASPFITTCVDALSLLVYFGMSNILLF